MNTAFFYINAEFWCWALRHQFNIMIGHRKTYSSRDFLEIPKHGNYSSFLTGREVQVEKWNSLLSVPKWDREWKKADLCYLWLYRPGYHPLTQINVKHFSGVSASWSHGWSLTVAKRPCTGVCGEVWGYACVHGALCSLHRLHMWLIAPHVLWCCFHMLHSFRSFLVPNPYLYTSCSGNSFVFSSPEYSRILICSLRIGVPHNFFFFSPTQTFWETSLVLTSSKVPRFLHQAKGFKYACVPPTPFPSVRSVNHSEHLWQEGQSCGGGIVMLGDAAVPGLWWKDNCRLDWWLLDAQTCCQGSTCPALPFSFSPGSEGHCLKTSKISGLGGCVVQKPSALHLNKVMPSSWLQGPEHFSNSFPNGGCKWLSNSLPNGEHNWFTLVKFHTKSRHSDSPLGLCWAPAAVNDWYKAWGWEQST